MHLCHAEDIFPFSVCSGDVLSVVTRKRSQVCFVSNACREGRDGKQNLEGAIVEHARSEVQHLHGGRGLS